jgi:cytochrome c oxidase assembly factor CtaG
MMFTMSVPFAALSGVDVAGLAIEIAIGGLYLSAAARPSPRGNRWPRTRTACFLAGLALLAFALQLGPIAAHDETPWVHSLQHVMLMMVAPPLLVLGSPITLLLRTLSPQARREVVAVLRDPAMRSVTGRWGSVGLTLEYYGTMYLVVLTPLYKLSLEHQAIHVAIHAYLITCGLLFWMPLIGRDPAGWRPSPAFKQVMVGLGVPANLLLALIVGARSAPLGAVGTLSATHQAAWVLGAGGVVMTIAGLALLWFSAPGSVRVPVSAASSAVYLRPPEL